MVLGVTGGIASGKTAVAQIFKELGAVVVGADELAREVVRPGSSTLQKIVEYFGDRALLADGTLNRPLLAELIFNDPQARSALNRVTHPAIAALAEKRLRQAEQAGASLVIYDAPLLYEAGADRQVDKVLVVAVDEEVQLRRLMARDGVGREQALARIAAQMPLAEKIARADYVVDNSGSPRETRRQVSALLERLGHFPGGPTAPGNAG
ncbi:MAG: dephospho-CoA kinase [Syntrophotaleaceae bacterium]